MTNEALEAQNERLRAMVRDAERMANEHNLTEAAEHFRKALETDKAREALEQQEDDDDHDF